MKSCSIKSKTFNTVNSCIEFIETMCKRTEKKLNYRQNFVVSDFNYDKEGMIEVLDYYQKNKKHKDDLLFMVRLTGFTVVFVEQWKKQYNNDTSNYSVYQLKLNRNNNIKMTLIEG